MLKITWDHMLAPARQEDGGPPHDRHAGGGMRHGSHATVMTKGAALTKALLAAGTVALLPASAAGTKGSAKHSKSSFAKDGFNHL
jgi:hypothetical protein